MNLHSIKTLYVDRCGPTNETKGQLCANSNIIARLVGTLCVDCSRYIQDSPLFANSKLRLAITITHSAQERTDASSVPFSTVIPPIKNT